MPTYISQGRYSREAIQGMIKSPEDRTDAVSKLAQSVGGKLLWYYVTFGDLDRILAIEAPDERAALSERRASCVLIAAVISSRVRRFEPRSATEPRTAAIPITSANALA